MQIPTLLNRISVIHSNYKVTFKAIYENGTDFIYSRKTESGTYTTYSFEINGEDKSEEILDRNLTTDPITFIYPECELHFNIIWNTPYARASYFKPNNEKFYLNKDTEILLTYYVVNNP